MEYQYQTQAVQALSLMWQEFEPALRESLENMPPMQRIWVRGVLDILSVPNFLRRLDQNPESVKVIKRGLEKVIEAMKEEERHEG